MTYEVYEKTMKRKKLWLISEVFYPDIEIATGNIATEIALKFSEKYDVHIICGPVGYEKKNDDYSEDVLAENVFIHRVKHFNYDKNNKVKRVIRVIGISMIMFIIGFKIRQNDKVFVISNPAFIVPFFAILKWLKKFEFTLLMHDVFPENLIPGGYLKETDWLYKFLESVFKHSRSKAKIIAVLGRDMQHLIQRKLPANSKTKTIIIPNWADIENVFPVPSYESNLAPRKLVVQFAGNHGVLQNLTEFLKIIERIKNPEIKFVFAGSGALKEKLITYAKNANLNNVAFHNAFPRSELNKYMNNCDIGIVSLSNSLYGVGVPSKSYNISAAGKPIIFFGNLKTEIAMFVVENSIGWAFSYDEPLKIVDFFNNLNMKDISYLRKIGKHAREVVKKGYSKEIVLQKLFDSV